MNILFTTLALLSLIALLASGKIDDFLGQRLLSGAKEAAWQDRRQRQFERAEWEWMSWRTTAQQVDEQTGGDKRKLPENSADTEHPKEKALPPLRLDAETWRNKLELGALKSGEKAQAAGASQLREAAARLMRKLYGKATFFKELPGLEYEILDAIAYAIRPPQILPPDHIGFRCAIGKPHHLTAVAFRDPRVRAAYCKMMAGSEDTRPLLQYFTLHGRSETARKVRLHTAPEEILEAVLGNQEAAQELCGKRNALYEKAAYRYRGGVYTKAYLSEQEVKRVLDNFRLNDNALDLLSLQLFNDSEK